MIINAVYPKDTILIEVNESKGLLNNELANMMHSAINSAILFDKYSMKHTTIGHPKTIEYRAIKSSAPDTIVIS